MSPIKITLRRPWLWYCFYYHWFQRARGRFTYLRENFMILPFQAPLSPPPPPKSRSRTAREWGYPLLEDYGTNKMFRFLSVPVSK
ncbi:hypothetical protein HOLleu_10328 [Holothuria leucospilota]|uniref:Uncharacterized protein n=1 Tax=Holothuria leucospilota TaxID=206669 RepID=A0A9Q1CDE7_HOLLE|nr:hypothetical protein HOLleu_10328 [Holothuria leucospilota]